jgi:hypothetical protein
MSNEKLRGGENKSNMSNENKWQHARCNQDDDLIANLGKHYCCLPTVKSIKYLLETAIGATLDRIVKIQRLDDFRYECTCSCGEIENMGGPCRHLFCVVNKFQG